MDDPNIHVITTEEHHYLPTCPCGRCVIERERRGLTPAHQPHVCHLTPEAAYLLGFLPSRHPQGSVARALMLRDRHGGN